MQLFIGGASAGKRDAVKQRFPSAVWWRLAPGQRLHEVAHVMLPNTPLVLHGLFEWLTAAQDSDFSRDEWRAGFYKSLPVLMEMVPPPPKETYEDLFVPSVRYHHPAHPHPSPSLQGQQGTLM